MATQRMELIGAFGSAAMFAFIGDVLANVHPAHIVPSSPCFEQPVAVPIQLRSLTQ